MNPLNRLGASIKAAVSLTPDRATPFSAIGGNGLQMYGPVGFGGPLGPGGQASRTQRDMWRAIGEPGDNGIVASIGAAVSQAFTSAPPVLERKTSNAEGSAWERVDHPIIDLLNNPNGAYGANHLWQVSICSQIDKGNGFWRVCMNRTRTQPVELWYEREMQPVYDEYEFVRSYIRRVAGAPYVLQPGANGIVPYRSDYAIHFRYQVDRYNPRWGWTPLNAVVRQLMGDNAVAMYHTGILENSAVASLFVSLKEANADMKTKDLEDLLAMMRRRLTGVGSGGIAGSNLPVDVTKVGFSPEELALDKLVTYFETRICSVLKTPPIILQLMSGLDPTYANQDGAIRDFWNRNIIPLQDDKGSEIEAQLFPLFGLDRSEYRIAWDRSQIQAIQDDMGVAHTIVREDYKAGIPDLYEVTKKLGYTSDDEMKGVRYTPPATGTDGENVPGNPVPSTKAARPLIPWTKREIRAQSIVGPEDAKRAEERASKHLQPFLEAVGDGE